jgi:hypothetical protein
MRLLFISLVALCAIAGPMQAATRFNCAVDDENLRLTLDTGFADSPGHKLNHIRGGLISKSADAPAEFKKLMLDSTQLTQSWSSDGELRIALAATGQGAAGDKSFELSLSASGKDKAAPMVGTYALTIWNSPDAAPLQFSGRLACNGRQPE